MSGVEWRPRGRFGRAAGVATGCLGCWLGTIGEAPDLGRSFPTALGLGIVPCCRTRRDGLVSALDGHELPFDDRTNTRTGEAYAAELLRILSFACAYGQEASGRSSGAYEEVRQ